MAKRKIKMNRKERERYNSLRGLALLFKELAKQEIKEKKRKRR